MKRIPLPALFAIKLIVLALVWSLGSGHRADASAQAEVARLQAHNADGNDLFGGALALSRDGRVLVVGADLEAGRGEDSDDNSLPGAGAVYVFERDSENHWVETAYLKAPVPTAGGAFGFAVALAADGQTLAVGAPFEPSDGIGSVHLFHRIGTQWSHGERLRAPQGAQRFGIALELSATGSELAVAATGPQRSLQAHVFGWRAERWSAQGVLEHPARGDASASPRLALSGQGRRLALASTGDARVQVFDATATGWSAGAVIDRPFAGSDEPAASVQSVLLSNDGRTLAVSGTTGCIGVHVDEAAQAWRAQARLQAAPGGVSLGHGMALSADGQALVVNAADNVPHVYRFQRHAGAWYALPGVTEPDGREGLFGSSLALSADGRWLAVGARLEAGEARWPWTRPAGPGAGSVHVYAPG
ncbi:MAG: hypothetical protein IBJ04_12805 [Hydrogenophaga sp.]|uniref:WD40 repeat domain-containing protein n=1 Tax=Hydrogenophaga sp. TaxID=1904254 RepID=UPI00257DEF56|nr:hypothetical protein [Hydrogenophaga sp.]MBL0945203.1 hypothetical protein [Hydrogenophaga sp.]